MASRMDETLEQRLWVRHLGLVWVTRRALRKVGEKVEVKVLN
jgi:hypothetical protein